MLRRECSMVKRHSPVSLFRASVAIGDRMLLSPRSSGGLSYEGMCRKGRTRCPVIAPTGEQRSNSSCSGAPHQKSSLSSIFSALNFTQSSEFLYDSSSWRDCDVSRETAVSCPFKNAGWVSNSSFKRPVSERREFATAAINIEERGKCWRGKGWNRVGFGDKNIAVDVPDDPSAASQFDGIPDVEEKLKFLETYGLGDNQLKHMRRRLPTAMKNTFLKLSVKKLVEVATLLEEDVGIERKDLGNILFANPYIAGSSVDDCLRPKIEFLRSRGISKEQMGKMVLRSPQLLTYSMTGKILAIEKKLLEIGLKGDEIARVFIKHPAIFGTSIVKFDKNIQSMRDGGLNPVAEAILKLPQIMTLSLDKKIEQVTGFLRDELKLQQEQITKILSRHVALLSINVQDNYHPKVEYFSEIGLRQEDLARLFVKYPNVFCHSLEKSIKPKVEYLLTVMNLEVRELISFPHFVSYSLQGRILPRHEYVAKHGLNFTLSSLLSCADDVFKKRYPEPLNAQTEDTAVLQV